MPKINTVSKSIEEYTAQCLALQLFELKLPQPQREHRFYETRRWKFDYAWPGHKIAVEAEGGVWSGGRHVRGAGYLGDMEKYNEAALLGWIVLRFTPDQIQRGEAMPYIREALKQRMANHDRK
jgi:very-short-patch-repair endonuclease